MKWLRSIRDLAVDVTVAVGLEVSALFDEWRDLR